jgi:hypothetical protein
MECVDTLVARVQAVVDQATGLQAIVEGHHATVTVGQMMMHYTKLTELLGAAIDAYTQEHGCPPLPIDMGAIQWLLDGLRP